MSMRAVALGCIDSGSFCVTKLQYSAVIDKNQHNYLFRRKHKVYVNENKIFLNKFILSNKQNTTVFKKLF